MKIRYQSTIDPNLFIERTDGPNALSEIQAKVLEYQAQNPEDPRYFFGEMIYILREEVE